MTQEEFENITIEIERMCLVFLSQVPKLFFPISVETNLGTLKIHPNHWSMLLKQPINAISVTGTVYID